jgi:ATP diphosphatase
LPEAGLANIAATVLELAGFHPPTFYEHSLVQITTAKQIKLAEDPSLLTQAIKKTSLPTLNFAMAVSKAATDIGFCWPTLKEVFANVESEILELKAEIEQSPLNIERLADEIGDVIFSVATLVSCLENTHDVDLDLVTRQSIDKFIHRFTEMEKIYFKTQGKLTAEAAKQLSLERWNQLWREAKKVKKKLD